MHRKSIPCVENCFQQVTDTVTQMPIKIQIVMVYIFIQYQNRINDPLGIYYLNRLVPCLQKFKATTALEYEEISSKGALADFARSLAVTFQLRVRKGLDIKGTLFTFS